MAHTRKQQGRTIRSICYQLAATSILLTGTAQAQPAIQQSFTADITIAQYQSNPRLPTTMAYLNGVAAGLRYTFAIYNLNGMPLLYCIPSGQPDLQLSTDDLLRMIDEELARSPDFTSETTLPIGVVLLRAMQKNFPCPQPGSNAK